MGDLAGKLDEIAATVSSARGLPMSASCVLHRDELLAALEELRGLLPAEVAAARGVLAERADVVADGRREAAALLADARAERERLLEESSIVAAARERAAAVLTDAAEDAERMRRETDDYVDGKLATFEIALHKTLGAVQRGRDKLRGRSDLDSIALPDDGAPVALPG